MRYRRFLLGLSVAVLLAPAAPGAETARRGARRAPLAAAKTFLGLSDQQVEQLVQLRRDERQALQPVRQQMKDKAQALQQLRQSTNPDPAAVGQLVLDMQKLREQARTVDGDYHKRALDILDATQREKVQNLQNAAQRMARTRRVVGGAAALNLLERPKAGAGQLRGGAMRNALRNRALRRGFGPAR